MNVTKIPLPGNTYTYVCEDCGDYAEVEADIRHHSTCTPTDMNADNFNADPDDRAGNAADSL